MDQKIKDYKFIRQIAELPFVEAIILYGSRARGDSRPRSDIDLAIVAPKASRLEWFEILNIVDEADTLLKIDCVRFDELEPDDDLRKSIERNAVYIFKKSGL